MSSLNSIKISVDANSNGFFVMPTHFFTSRHATRARNDKKRDSEAQISVFAPDRELGSVSEIFSHTYMLRPLSFSFTATKFYALGYSHQFLA